MAATRRSRLAEAKAEREAKSRRQRETPDSDVAASTPIQDDPLPPTHEPQKLAPVADLYKKPPIEREWTEDDKRLIAWTTVVAGPQEPFWLTKGIQVVRPEIWWPGLMAEIAAGPNHPRCRTGATLGDVQKYRDYLAICIGIE